MTKTEEKYYEIAGWLELNGYSFDKTDDGLWWEEEVTEHKWKDIFCIMYTYSAHEVRKCRSVEAEGYEEGGFVSDEDMERIF